ncbi:MAG: DUF2490 domain-containing protein [Bergeyella sp.]
MKNILFGLLVLMPFSFSAQTDFKPHVSNFNMTSFTYKHNEKWSVYAEAQIRSVEEFSLPDYYEIKGGPAYNFNKNNQIMVGFGRYGTYRNSDFYQREYRLWLQYVLSQRFGRLKIDHRARAEKRFFNFPQNDTSSSDERFRYRLSATVPVNKTKIEQGAVFFNTFEEVFLGPENTETSAFKRQRLYGGFGYQLNSFMNVNAGYMWQTEFSEVKEDRNYHFVYFALNFTFDRLKNYDEQSVPAAD